MAYKNTDQLLEIYKLHCQLTDSSSNRRMQVNSFFIGLITILISLFPFVINFQELAISTKCIILILISFLGIALCTIWKGIIDNFKRLHKIKFKQLEEIEQELQYQFYENEWEAFNYDENITKFGGVIIEEKNIPNLLIIVLLINVVIAASILTCSSSQFVKCLFG